MNLFEYFVKYLFAPLILFGGLLGNLLSLITLSSKKLDRIGPRFIYQSLIIVDTLVIMQILQIYLVSVLDKDFPSNILCSFCWYSLYVTSSMSPFLLCYTSIEKVASIIYCVKKLKQKSIQMISFVIIFMYNMSIHVRVLFSFEMFLKEMLFSNTNISLTNQTKAEFCDYKDLNTRLTLSYIDLFNRVILPFPIMILTSVWLIYKIIFSRKKALGKNGSDKGFLRRLRLSTTTITFNIVYLFLNLPQIVGLLLPQYDSPEIMLFYLTVTYASFVSFAINFIVLFISNRLFRQQLFHMLRITDRQNKRNTTI